MKVRTTTGERVFSLFNMVVLAGFSILTIYPLLYVLFASLSDPVAADAAAGQVIISNLTVPTGTSTIQGQVTLPQGYHVIGDDMSNSVSIWIKDANAGATPFGRAITRTTPTGQYVASGLPAGTYNLYVVAPGLQPYLSSSITVLFFNGSIRTSENEEMAHLLRRKAKILVAFGSCAGEGCIPGLANCTSLEEILRYVYQESPSTVNLEGIRPQPEYEAPEGVLRIPRLWNTVRTLPQVVDVVIDNDFIANAVAACEHDTTIDGVQAKVYQYSLLELDASGALSRSVIDTCGFAMTRARRVVNIGHGRPDGPDFAGRKDIFGVEGAVPFFRRSALLASKVDGMLIDPDYFWYGDDLDLAWRLTLMGHRQVIIPEVVAWRDRSSTKGAAAVPRVPKAV